MPTNKIITNLAKIHAELATVCARVNRDPQKIKIVAVTKTRSPAEINSALAAGIQIIGENRVQEALAKFPEVQKCERHFIGHLQSNKIREAVNNFDCVESVDSVRLAEQLNAAAGKFGKTLEIFLQANLAAEDTKSGFAASELLPAVKKIRQLANLKLTGLLVIGPHTNNESAIQKIFTLGQKLGAESGLPNYSAGMSADWPLAVACGATHLRLGSVLFGRRD